MTDSRLTPPDEFERELGRLGPLMWRQELVMAKEPDPEFVRSLRTRLTGEPDNLVPAREPAVDSRRSRLRSRLAGRWAVAGGLSLAAIACGVVLALAFNSGTAHSPGPITGTGKRTAFRVPTPGKNDILRGYPVYGLGAGGGPPAPWFTDLGLPVGMPYSGPLRLTAASLPPGLTSASAYRLRGPSFDAPRMAAIARTLGIVSHVKTTAQVGVPWTYAVDRPTPVTTHSVAVNARTGELIYHDTRYASGPFNPNRQAGARDMAAARAWLTSIGWPGAQMKLHIPHASIERDLGWIVRLDWAAAGPSDSPAAYIQVDRSGHVFDAYVFPPVGASTVVPTRTYRTVWSDVHAGKVPVGVEQMQGLLVRTGAGSLRSASPLWVLTVGTDGRYYLVPAYRFSGTATFPGVSGPRNWYAVAPSQK